MNALRAIQECYVSNFIVVLPELYYFLMLEKVIATVHHFFFFVRIAFKCEEHQQRVPLAENILTGIT